MSQDFDARIVRWSEDPSGLSVDECARQGIEAVAGLLITEDIFGTNVHPDAHFCTCAELNHTVTGTSGNFDDNIGVNFRVVEIVDGIYPLVGVESVRMIIQPLSNGKVSASWYAVDPAPEGAGALAGESLPGDQGSQSRTCTPMILGPMEEQQDRDAGPPSFLILKDPGAGWQIWRRYSVRATGDRAVEGADLREESYTMVYPLISPHMMWSFRVYDIPGGSVRWEVNPDNRS